MKVLFESLLGFEVMEIKSNLLKDERLGELEPFTDACAYEDIVGSTTSDASNGPASRSSLRRHALSWPFRAARGAYG